MISKEKIEEYKKMLKELNFDDEVIEDKIFLHKLLDGWEAVSLNEMEKMTKEELSELLSVCWHDGFYRCDCIGVSDLEVKKSGSRWDVQLSDSNGDPSFEVLDKDEPINNIGDGTWNYGFFKKIQL